MNIRLKKHVNFSSNDFLNRPLEIATVGLLCKLLKINNLPKVDAYAHPSYIFSHLEDGGFRVTRFASSALPTLRPPLILMPFPAMGSRRITKGNISCSARAC